MATTIVRRVLAGASLAVAAAAVAAGGLGRITRDRPEVSLGYGMPLYHAGAGGGAASTTRMPLPTVLQAAAQHGPAWMLSALDKAMISLTVLAAFAAGAALRSPASGAASACLAAWLFARGTISFDETVFGGLTLLCIACASTLASRRWLLSQSILGFLAAAALSVKGVIMPWLILSPLVDLRLERGLPWRRRLAGFAGLAILPIGIIGIWGLVHVTATGRFGFIEASAGRADSNVVSGALGLLGTIEGDPRAMAGIPRDADVFWWAAKEVLAHPLRYLWAYCRRLGYFFSLSPWLVAAGIAAFWVGRRDASWRRFFVLLSSYVGVHCLMAVEERYFGPALLLLCPAAASWLGILDGDSKSKDGFKLGMTVLGFCGAFLLFAFILTWGMVLRYLVGGEQGLEVAVRSAPADSCLWRLLAESRQGAGRHREAESAFRKALRLDPSNEVRHQVAVSLYAAGATDAEARRELEALSGQCGGPEWNIPLVSALLELERGRLGEASKLIRSAKERYQSAKLEVRLMRAAHERAAYERLVRNDSRLIDNGLRPIAALLPSERRHAVWNRLLKILPDAGPIPAGLGPVPEHRLADWFSAPWLPRPLRVASPFARSRASYWTDKGVDLWEAGNREDAESSFRRAFETDPAFLPGVLSLGACLLSTGRSGEASAVYREALDRAAEQRRSAPYELLERDYNSLMLQRRSEPLKR